MNTNVVTAWKLGEHRIHLSQYRHQKMIDILDMLRVAEERHAKHIREAKSELALMVPQIRQQAIHKADISKRAHLRLQQYYTNLLNDTSL